MKLKISNCRLAFPQLFEAKSVNNEGDPRFGAVFIVEPGSDNAKALSVAVKTTAFEKWGVKADAILKELNAKDRVAYKAAAKTNASGDVYDGFEGKHHVNTSRPENKGRPLVIGADKSPLVPADGKPYAGCYVDASIELWPQDNKYGKRINATLLGVQFRRDGDAFSGGSVANTDDFDDLSEGSEAEMV